MRPFRLAAALLLGALTSSAHAAAPPAAVDVPALIDQLQQIGDGDVGYSP